MTHATETMIMVQLLQGKGLSVRMTLLLAYRSLCMHE